MKNPCIDRCNSPEVRYELPFGLSNQPRLARAAEKIRHPFELLGSDDLTSLMINFRDTLARFSLEELCNAGEGSHLRTTLRMFNAARNLTHGSDVLYDLDCLPARSHEYESFLRSTQK